MTLSRHEETRARLADRAGLIAWWPGPACPHPEAARVLLELPIKADPPRTAEPWALRSEGWAVAVRGPEDLFPLARVRRQVTLIDLATGSWLQAGTRRSSHDLGTLMASPLATTTDALGRPRATVKHAMPAQDASRCHVEDFSPRGSIERYTWEEPIFDSEWFGLRQGHSSRVFQSFSSFCQHAPRPKLRGVDCNLAGPGGGLPQGYAFDSTGISVFLFAEDSRHLDASRVAMLRGMSQLKCVLGQYKAFDLPLDLVVAAPECVPWVSLDVLAPDGFDSPSRARIVGQRESDVLPFSAPPVFPFAFPLMLRSMEMLECEFILQPGPSLVVDFGFFVRVMIHGFFHRGSH